MRAMRRARWVVCACCLAIGSVGAKFGPADTPTAGEQARFNELEARPIQTLSNVELAEFLELRTRARRAAPEQPKAGDEAGWLAVRSLGQEFRLNAVQFDLAEGDCVSFVNRTLALSMASDWQSYYLLVERIRHKDGLVQYRNRNFFTLGDWMPNNAWLLSDITTQLGSDGTWPIQFFTHVIRPKVFDERPAAPGSKFVRVTFKGSDYQSPNSELVTDTFVPAGYMTYVLDDLRTGDVVLVLRSAAGGHLGCDHMGLIIRGAADDVTLVHSVPPSVRQEPLLGFLDRCKWVVGLRFLRIRDDARELAAREVSRMAEKAGIKPPEIQDHEVSVLRARRGD